MARWQAREVDLFSATRAGRPAGFDDHVVDRPRRRWSDLLPLAVLAQRHDFGVARSISGSSASHRHRQALDRLHVTTTVKPCEREPPPGTFSLSVLRSGRTSSHCLEPVPERVRVSLITYAVMRSSYQLGRSFQGNALQVFAKGRYRPSDGPCSGPPLRQNDQLRKKGVFGKRLSRMPLCRRRPKTANEPVHPRSSQVPRPAFPFAGRSRRPNNLVT